MASAAVRISAPRWAVVLAMAAAAAQAASGRDGFFMGMVWVFGGRPRGGLGGESGPFKDKTHEGANSLKIFALGVEGGCGFRLAVGAFLREIGQ